MARPLGLRLESLIGFQSADDAFCKEAEAILGKIKEQYEEGFHDFEVNRETPVKELEALINNRFKMTCSINTEGTSASVVPFFANDNSVLMREVFRQTEWLESEKPFIAPKATLNGFVDIENVRLGGDYTKGKTTLYLNFNRLFASKTLGGYDLTVRQVMAAMLHELGHMFYALAFANRIDHANLIFEQATKDILSKKKDVIKLTTKAIADVTGKENPKLAQDLTSTDPLIATKAVMKLLGEVTLQHQVSGKYTNTNFEMLADNFATRFGYGEDLVITLEKMNPGGVRNADVFSAVMVTLRTIGAVFTIAGFMSVINTIISGKANLETMIRGALLTFMGLGPAVMFLYTCVRTAGESSRDYTYDDLVVRYSRIRQQMIARIKEKKLTKNDAALLIDQIDFIGNLIKNGRNLRGPMDMLFNVFNPADRRAKDSIQRQQALEQLVNNDLFLASLKLSQIA